MATIAVTRRFDLTDAQWARLEPLLPTPKKSGRPSNWTKRQLVDRIRWRVRTGAPWRDVPACYGCWQAVYALFRRWQRAGVWQQIATALQARVDAAGLIGWDVSVDSTISRAHQHAAGARRRPDLQREAPGGVGCEPADHALGRSRGGLTTKLHLACEQGQKPLSLVLTAGQRGDSPQFIPVLNGIRVPRPGGGRPRTRPDRSSPTRPTRPRPFGGTCADAGSRPPSRARPTRTPTDATGSPKAAGHRRSTPTSTSSATPWNAASTGSNATAPWPPATTNSQSDTKPPSTSSPSTSGSTYFETRPRWLVFFAWR